MSLIQTWFKRTVQGRAKGFFRRHALALTVSAVFLVFWGPAGAWAAGRIQGTLGICRDNGQWVHGDWIRVLLVTGPVPVPLVDFPADLPAIARRDRLGALHQDFFVNVRKAMAQPHYLVATTLTTEDGAFLFPQVPPGAYTIIVTFPALIAGIKVAWQVPVRAVEGQTTEVVLEEANMALPPAAR